SAAENARSWLLAAASWLLPVALELQPALAGGVGQGLDPPVVLEPAAVEDHGLDPLLLGPGRDQRAHGLGRGHVRAPIRLRPACLVGRGGRAGRLALLVVDDLDVDVALAAEHGQPRPRGRARDLLADARADAVPDVSPGLD